MKVFSNLSTFDVYKNAVQSHVVKIDEDRAINVIVFKQPQDGSLNVQLKIINGTISTNIHLSMEAALAIHSAIGLIQLDSTELEEIKSWFFEVTPTKKPAKKVKPFKTGNKK